jgi:ribosomal protein S18 acetylase RimI-like enzyme
LTERLLERANDRGCGAAWLATEADNAAARALYRSLAGRETGDIVVYDWGDAMS